MDDPDLTPTRSRFGAGAIAAAVGVVVVAAVVAALVLHVVGDDSPHDLLVVGDSVTFLSGGALDKRYERSHLQYVAIPGAQTGEVLPLVKEAIDGDEAGSAKDRATVLVGYNDIFHDDVETHDLVELMDTMDQFRCVVWFTIPSRPGGEPNSSPLIPSAKVDRWNARIEELAKDRDHIHVAHDWDDVVTEGDPATLLDDDGIHPSKAGARRLADAMVSALERDC
jgi:hypothetical protein